MIISKKSIAIHQPNFLPWMGYFYKMKACDTFVYLDDVAFSKGSYTNRVHIHSAKNREENQWLTIPVKSFSLGTHIKDIEIDQSQDFQDMILGQFHAAYRTASHYKEIAGILEELLNSSRSSPSLAEFNIFCAEYIRKLLGLDIEIVRSSTLDLEAMGSDRVLQICLALNSDKYISGMGAKKYQDEGAFAQKSIAIEYVNYPGFVAQQKTVLENGLLNKSILSYLVEDFPVQNLL